MMSDLNTNIKMMYYLGRHWKFDYVQVTVTLASLGGQRKLVVALNVLAQRKCSSLVSVTKPSKQTHENF